MKRKKLDQLFALFFVCILTVLAFAYCNEKNKRRKQLEFYNLEFSSKVVSSNSFYGRSIEFHLQNGFTLYFLPPINNRLIIGDSIEKKKMKERMNIMFIDKVRESTVTLQNTTQNPFSKSEH
ncbi:hypothetical protein [Edaphocola flava]|uniref:hypothetical protein n=1 Tax=Edaphocola flava TaxID=2499629 RepID=UPI00100B4E0B|nr:hypothetical protein [Edaphocola flava]